VHALVSFVASLALAGHSEEVGAPNMPVILPYELFMGIIGVAALMLIALVWLAGNAWRLRKLDQRLRVLEGKLKQ
jgi:uncharacterized membrane protein required for colicin V production